jgi:transcriptional/translational regulatory protein YebC/TACO1
MLSVDTIEAEILELESNDTTYAVCSKLADLYTVRDHIKSKAIAETNEAGIEYDTGTEFADAVNGKCYSDVFPVLDELMETIRLLQPRVYASAITKIKQA